MTNPLLGDREAQSFLRDYWQKKPLLIRQALPGFEVPFSPEELAGLACESDVESRLILEKDGAHPWQVKHGPLSEEDFAHLPETHWTLLVQEINRHLPELALLLDRFRFVPHWRLDDLMVSYAPKHGSVGPHIDEYDVFLIQGAGKRRWQISHQPVGPEDLIPDLALRIMKEFKPEQDWVLEPGDMLYLPPRVAHYGVAQDNDCMTFSVGFRAPTRNQLWEHFIDYALEKQADVRYTDPDLSWQQHPGEIGAEAIAHVQALLESLRHDRQSLQAWFGRFVTEPRGPFSSGTELAPEKALTLTQFLKELQAQEGLWRSEAVRFAYIRENEETTTLFIDGQAYPLSGSIQFMAEWLTDQRHFHFEQIQPLLKITGFGEQLLNWYHAGYVYFPE